jgi:hypothetical protein
METFMKIVILALLVAIAAPLSAGRRRAVAPPSGMLSIEFVDVPSAAAGLFAAGPDAWIDLAAVRQEAGTTGSSLRQRRQFAVRIVRSGGLSWGTVRLTASRAVSDSRCSLRIDGHALGSAPMVIDARAEVGAVILHTLEIEVPVSAAPGPLDASISWQATAQ